MFEFLKMGEYTFYVWTSVGAVLAVFALFTWRTQMAFNKVRDIIIWSRHVEP